MNPKQKNYIFLISAIAALGGLLFGFDTAVISGTTPFIKPYFKLDDIWLGWTVSSLLGGCIIGVISAGKPSDVFGRKKTLMTAAVLFAFSAIGSALAHKLTFFIGFRIIRRLWSGNCFDALADVYFGGFTCCQQRKARLI